MAKGWRRRWNFAKAERQESAHKQAVSHRRLYKERLAANKCTRCGLRSPKSPSSRCAKCLKSLCDQYQRRKEDAWGAALLRYGVGCACCGEMNKLFLTLDHKTKKARDSHRDIDGAPLSGTRISIKPIEQVSGLRVYKPCASTATAVEHVTAEFVRIKVGYLYALDRSPCPQQRAAMVDHDPLSDTDRLRSYLPRAGDSHRAGAAGRR